MGKFTYFVRDVYGTLRMYPANETAKIFAALGGKKTFDKLDLELIKALGFEVIQTLPLIKGE